MSIKFNKCCDYIGSLDCPMGVNNIWFE